MTYKVIFTDFKMPKMDGIDATKKIREVLSEYLNVNIEDQPKIYGVTGYVLEKYKNKGIRAGMD